MFVHAYVCLSVCLNFRMFRHRITERILTEVEVSTPNVVIPLIITHHSCDSCLFFTEIELTYVKKMR
jgi:hypothetical protein